MVAMSPVKDLNSQTSGKRERDGEINECTIGGNTKSQIQVIFRTRV